MTFIVKRKFPADIFKKIGIGDFYFQNKIWSAQMSKWSSNLIRSSFLSFFEERGHTYVPSSPVIAWNDPSLDFVNAGMNQFKPVFLGKMQAPVKAAVNYQKCIRVGGKHNDLSDVGLDTYHHTFFEMLGNWSFQGYSKKDACQMSWELLTKVYRIAPEHLYVTYFGGDEGLQLAPDHEVQEIWRSIGLPTTRILPFGLKENFWEMGKSGPCGPCTEIHYKRYLSSQGYMNVNNGGEDLIELWNLVFIQCERTTSGAVISLDKTYIDTGMGLERLIAILNGKSSNYDTDLFLPLFDIIEKLSLKPKYNGNFSKVCLDTYYRILADHARMITTSLADGLLPHDSENLRKVIRRCLVIGSEKFCLDCETNWLGILCKSVTDILGQTYPELVQQLDKTKLLLEYETDVWREAQLQISKEWDDITGEIPIMKSVTYRTQHLIEALKYIKPNLSKWREKGNTFPLEEALKICKDFYLQPNAVEETIQLLNFDFDYKEFRNCTDDDKSFENIFSNDKENSLYENTYRTLSNMDLTNDIFKYNYVYNLNGSVETEPHVSKIIIILDSSGNEIHEVSDLNDKSCGPCGIVLNSTNFFSIAGGQNYDTGTINIDESVFNVNKVINLNGHIVHYGQVCAGNFKVGDEVLLNINKGLRAAIAKHHTAQHLFVAALKSITGMAFQRESKVSSNQFVLDIFKYPSLELMQIAYAEKIVQSWISQAQPVHREDKNIFDALKGGVSLSSGEKYPDYVYVISTSCVPPSDINGLQMTNGCVRSSELCCGTHVHNTSLLDNFAITDIKERAKGVTRITGVCGKEASKLNNNVAPVKRQLESWNFKINEAVKNDAKLRSMNNEFKVWKQTIKKSSLPATFYLLLISEYNHLSDIMNKILVADSNWKELLTEFRDVISRNPNEPIAIKLNAEYRGSLTDLEKIVQEAHDRPAAFVCSGWGRVRACIFIPKDASGRMAIEELMSNLVECKENGSIRVNTTEAGDNIGTFVLNGVKSHERSMTELNILKLCKKFIINK